MTETTGTLVESIYVSLHVLMANIRAARFNLALYSITEQLELHQYGTHSRN